MHWHMFRYGLSLALLLRQTLFGTLGRIDSVFRLLALTIDVMIVFTSATLQDEEINITVFLFLGWAWPLCWKGKRCIGNHYDDCWRWDAHYFFCDTSISMLSPNYRPFWLWSAQRWTMYLSSKLRDVLLSLACERQMYCSGNLRRPSAIRIAGFLGHRCHDMWAHPESYFSHWPFAS